MNNINAISRRDFILRSIGLGTGLSLIAIPVLAGGNPIVGANDRLRIGVIGLGRHGGHHLREYLRSPNVEIAALCDIDKNRLKMTAERLVNLGRRRPFMATDYRRLLELPGIDAVSVATPKDTRAKIGIAACDTGKNVLLEKPFSGSIKEGRRLVSKAFETNTLVQQCELNSLTDIAGLTATASLADSGEILSVNASKAVAAASFAEDRYAQRQGRQAHRKLIESALDEIDIARCLLDVSVPTSITTTCFEKDNRLPLQFLFQFEFNPGMSGKNRILTIDLKFDSRSTALSRNFFGDSRGIAKDRTWKGPLEHFETECTLKTSKAEFTIFRRSEPESDVIRENSWFNFISCIRNNSPEMMQNPIYEAEKSCSLLYLAEQSLTVGDSLGASEIKSIIG